MRKAAREPGDRGLPARPDLIARASVRLGLGPEAWEQEAQAPEPIADEVIVDGRESGLPPRYDFDDPSAAEAAIQQEEEGEGPVIGSPEGDGDFAPDNREPASAETSADESEPAAKPEEPSGLEKIIDEISHGTLLP